MQKILLFSLLMISFRCAAQDTLYFDEEWNRVSQDEAVFYRIDQKAGKFWTRCDYYMDTRQLQMKGTYSSIFPEVEEGMFEWYSSDGKLRHKGAYKKGEYNGAHLWYDENGILEAKETYKSGKLDGAYEEYYPDGKLMIRIAYVNGVENGKGAFYWENGAKGSEGAFKNGIQAGEWKYYDDAGRLSETRIFKLDFTIPEAKMSLQMPNVEWYLSRHYSKKERAEYVFKRNEIADSLGSSVIPAIMLYVEDATGYKQDIVMFSTQKRAQFSEIGIEVDRMLIHENEDFPLPYKNAILFVTHYNDQESDHVLYMIYIITKDNKGIQLYMDITGDVAKEYEQEFWTTLRSIKELK